MLKHPIKINYVGSLPAESSRDTFIVASDGDYCEACAILRAGNPNAIQAIWVRQEHYFSWLKAQLDHCGLIKEGNVIVARTTPASLLAERWGLEIPSWLSDDLILSERLLERNLPDHSTSVANGLLSPLTGALPVQLSAQFIGTLVEKTSQPQISVELGTPLLHSAWKSVLENWSQNGNSAWVAAFCSRLGDNPKKLWSDLTAWYLLRNYPASALDYALDPGTAAFVRALPAGAGSNMGFSPEGRQLALDQMTQLFASVRSADVTRPRFEFLLGAVSGEVVEEFDELEAMLERAEFTVSQDDITMLHRRFEHCANLPDYRRSRLSLLVPPKLPEAIDSVSAGAQDWKRWALEQYLPYRWWQIQRHVVEPKVEQAVADFSRWYCENYSLVHGDPQTSTVQLISRWREEILQDQFSLILLVDNLPWFFWELFEKALANAGLHRHQSEFSFTPLPSHTSVCKPQLISGKPDASGSEYLKQLQARSADEWQGRGVHYLMGVDQLAKLPATGEPYVALLNYLAADEALHTDAEASGSTWTEQLDLLFSNLAKGVGEFAKRVSGGGLKFGLYVLTDHGATLILPEERKAADGQLTKKLFPNEKHRSATLSESEATLVPPNLWSLGHRLQSPLSDKVYFIPRGHNTVASSGQRLTFVHGGATPEEVLVPSGLFRLFAASWKTPSLRFVDLEMGSGKARFYIKRIVKLTFEVQNPNAEECHVDGIQLSPSVGEVRHVDVTHVPGSGTAQGSLSLYFGDSAVTAENLTFTFNLRIGQSPIPRTIHLPVSITSATTGGLDLRNLFP